ncbi:flippase [Robertmurraya yapensis]|uniref:Flippase n=1 Tax=Bacillus yapensis TaxID=2492960 RepID=A0A3S0J276_9BACI|nr:flippase [Bacillus yapensis]RTR36412.1 flippase [Bacillus yapensis]TKT05916.1 flippase [Bacillus yapensis]
MSTKKKLLTNFFSLVILQGLNYILPLLTVPYLMRTVGITNYGVIALGQALAMIFVTITDYGFNLSATKQIAIVRDNKDKLQEVYSAVLGVKLFLMAISFIVVLIISILIPPFNEDSIFFLLFFGITVGTVLFPIWFFQGMEEMKFITLLNIISKTVFTIGLFVFVKDESYLFYVPILLASGHILVGIVSLGIVRYKFKVKFYFPNVKNMKYQLQQGWSIFLSNVAVSFFTSGNTVFLGMFSTKTQVGYFSSAEKLINAASSAVHPIAQTLFPHISNLADQSREAAIGFIQRSLKVILFVTVPITLITIIFAEPIIKIFYGVPYDETVIALRLLSVLPITIGVNNLLGVQTMITFGFHKDYSRILIICSIQNIIIACTLIPFLGYLGTVIAVLTTEISITIREYIFLRRKGINILPSKKRNVSSS